MDSACGCQALIGLEVPSLGLLFEGSFHIAYGFWGPSCNLKLIFQILVALLAVIDYFRIVVAETEILCVRFLSLAVS